ncbi:hypothetical protein MLD38_038560 [Melastoma candidum]|uniref:Uncharacterized protein n=1 Tax=Melastoma candidum TaxID=119954 RepID=A0ACB9KZ98_9MYRT|nr:hypothetical protein MLD38_038560 [Melastoma candidum]
MHYSSASPSPSTNFPLHRHLRRHHRSPKYDKPAHSPVKNSPNLSSSPATIPTSQQTPWVSAHQAASPSAAQLDAKLLSLLRRRQTEEAWALYTELPHLPNSTCLSRLVAQLSLRNSQESLRRALSVVSRLRSLRSLRLLDSNSLSLLSSSAALLGHHRLASSLLLSLLRSPNLLPSLISYSTVVSRLASFDPPLALRIFRTILSRLRRLDRSLASESWPDATAFNAALNACANLGDVRQFRQVFDEIQEFGVLPDAITYNVLIKLCVKAGKKELIAPVFERAVASGIDLCATTFHSVVSAYVELGELEMAENVVEAMRNGRRDICEILRKENMKKTLRPPDHAGVYDGDENFIDVKQDNPIPSDDNKDLFIALLPNLVQAHLDNPPLLSKTYSPNSRLYTTLMKGYMNAGRVADTVRMLEAMSCEEDASRHPDHVSYTTVVSALVKAGSMDQAHQVLAEMVRVGVPASRVTYNILLKGYCKQLQIDKAKELLKHMADVVGIEPDAVSYNTLINGCIMVDDSSGALELFNEMRARGIAPTKISYTTLMKAFALSGQPKLAHKVFDEMANDRRVKLDLVAWNMLVEGYCKLGLVEEAKKVIRNMTEQGFLPDVATYGSLANGISLARKPGEALLLWNEIKERMRSDDPSTTPLKPDMELLDALADICVRAAFFKKALEIVACMEENGISPNKTKYKRIYIEMHSRMFTSKHASQARQARRVERKRAAEAFKFWLGLPNTYYASEWHFYSGDGDGDGTDNWS